MQTVCNSDELGRLIMKMLDEKYLPYDYHYPEIYKKVMILGLVHLCPWNIMDSKNIKKHLEGLRKRYPDRKLIPFAKRQDNDDLACFEADRGEIVQRIHDFAAPGWEQRQTYKNFSEWFKEAFDDMNWRDLIDCEESIKRR